MAMREDAAGRWCHTEVLTPHGGAMPKASGGAVLEGVASARLPGEHANSGSLIGLRYARERLVGAGG